MSLSVSVGGCLVHLREIIDLQNAAAEKAITIGERRKRAHEVAKAIRRAENYLAMNGELKP